MRIKQVFVDYGGDFNTTEEFELPVPASRIVGVEWAEEVVVISYVCSDE